MSTSSLEVDHPTEGRILKTKTPNTFSGGMREDTHHAPHIGEQTREILAELGYADDDIEVMVKAGAVIEPEAR